MDHTLPSNQKTWGPGVWMIMHKAAFDADNKDEENDMSERYSELYDSVKPKIERHRKNCTICKNLEKNN